MIVSPHCVIAGGLCILQREWISDNCYVGYQADGTVAELDDFTAVVVVAITHIDICAPVSAVVVFDITVVVVAEVVVVVAGAFGFVVLPVTDGVAVHGVVVVTPHAGPDNGSLIQVCRIGGLEPAFPSSFSLIHRL